MSLVGVPNENIWTGLYRMSLAGGSQVWCLRGARGLHTVRSNTSWVITTQVIAPCGMTDTHLWKHYLPAISLAGLRRVQLVHQIEGATTLIITHSTQLQFRNNQGKKAEICSFLQNNVWIQMQNAKDKYNWWQSATSSNFHISKRLCLGTIIQNGNFITFDFMNYHTMFSTVEKK